MSFLEGLALFELEADPHNFGRKVMRQERGSDIWYQKPRSVFWESFFFGVNSPLKKVFDTKGQNGKSIISKYFFNLQVESTSNWSGCSKEVRVANSNLSNEHFYSFGALLAYCYLFGIRDLHRYNLVISNSHFQVVDVEVVCTNLILPHETILLPFKDMDFSLSGISCLADSIQTLSDPNKKEILCGFIDLLSICDSKIKEINLTLNVADRVNSPIRVILRNTRDYKDHLAGKYKLNDLLPEEVVQLKRGDIPYFFKYLCQSDLRWITDIDFNSSKVKDLGPFASDVNRHAINPNDIVGNKDIVFKRLIHGLLFLLKKFNIINHHCSFKFNDRIININKNSIELTNPNQIFIVSAL